MLSLLVTLGVVMAQTADEPPPQPELPADLPLDAPADPPPAVQVWPPTEERGPLPAAEEQGQPPARSAQLVPRPRLLARVFTQFGGGLAGLTVGGITGMVGGCMLQSMVSARADCGYTIFPVTTLIGVALGVPFGSWIAGEAVGNDSSLGLVWLGYLGGGLVLIPSALAIGALNSARFSSPTSPTFLVDLAIASVLAAATLSPFAGAILGSELSSAHALEIIPAASLSSDGGTVGFALRF